MKLGLYLYFIALLILGVLLAGCAQFDTGMAVGTQKGAEAADKALAGSMWYLCKGASVGAVQRKFGKAPEAYRAICEEHNLGVIGK